MLSKLSVVENQPFGPSRASVQLVPPLVVVVLAPKQRQLGGRSLTVSSSVPHNSVPLNLLKAISASSFKKCFKHWSRTKRATTETLNELPDNSRCVVIATGRSIGEGFDHPRLDTLFLTLPVSWRGTIAQYVGRLHRHHNHKQEIRVYDYADLQVPMLGT